MSSFVFCWLDWGFYIFKQTFLYVVVSCRRKWLMSASKAEYLLQVSAKENPMFWMFHQIILWCFWQLMHSCDNRHGCFQGSKSRSSTWRFYPLAVSTGVVRESQICWVRWWHSKYWNRTVVRPRSQAWKFMEEYLGQYWYTYSIWPEASIWLHTWGGKGGCFFFPLFSQFWVSSWCSFHDLEFSNSWQRFLIYSQALARVG